MGITTGWLLLIGVLSTRFAVSQDLSITRSDTVVSCSLRLPEDYVRISGDILKLEVQPVGLTLEKPINKEIILTSQPAAVTITDLLQGGNYRILCSILPSSGKRQPVIIKEEYVDISSNPGLQALGARLAKMTPDSVLIKFNLARSGPELLSLYYRKLVTADGQCIPPGTRMEETEVRQSYLIVSPFEIETNQERIEYSVKSPLLGLTKPVVVGSVQIYSGLNNHITDVERIENELHFTTEAFAEEVGNFVGVFQDGCGSCEAVLLPRCNELDIFVKLDSVTSVCTKKAPTRCVVGKRMQSNEASRNKASVTIEEPADLDTTQFVLTTWTENFPTYSGLPKITAQLSDENLGSRTLSWSAGSTVKTDTFQLTIWSGDFESKVKMQGVNTWTLSNLRPCAFHTVQISPLIDGSPVLEDSSPPLSFVTRGSTNDKPQLNVTHVVPGEVTVSWTESKECRGFTYVYALRQYTNGDPKPNEVKKSAETREHIFTGLSPCTRYQYRVVLQTSSDGTSVVESDPFELKTLPITLDGPSGVQASVSGSTVNVHWDAVSSGTACGVSEYMVTMTPYNESRSTITGKESGTSTTLELEECTWYDITVKAKFTDGEVWSEESKPIAVQSFLKPYPVPDFTITNLMPGVQKISWVGNIRWIHECVTKYEVVRHSADAQSTPVQFTMFSGTPGKIITGLEPCKEYHYTMRTGSYPGPAATGDGLTKTLMTMPASLVPNDFRGSAISYDTVRVTWSALPCSVSGATYTVKAQPTGKKRSTRQAMITDEQLQAGVVELAIEPCTLYAVYMDIDAFGNQNRSQVSMITSLDDLANIPAPEVVVSNVKPGIQRVSWNDLSEQTICDYLYVVTQTNMRNNTVFIRRTTATEKLFVQLEPCTEYEYTVHIQRRKQDSAGPKSIPVRLVSKATKPSTPTLLTLRTMGPTDVSLTWTAPEPPGDCRITGFVITAQPTNVTKETITAIVSGEARSAILTVDQCTLYAVFLQSKYDEGVISEKTDFRMISSQSEVPGLPTNLTVTKNSPHKQVVVWSAPVEPYTCEHTYEIEQVEFRPTGESKRNISLPSTFRSHIFQSLKSWTRYSYRIRIVGQPGDKVGPYTEAAERVTEPDRDEAKLVTGLMQAVGATENTITLQLHLTRLPPVPQLNSLSLLVQPQHEQTQVKHESVILENSLMENTTQTWAERQQSGAGAWEIKLWEKKTEEQTYSFEDRTLILGQDFACEKDVYCETGQLTPGTVYGIQLRIYSTTGSVISRQYFAATRTDMAALGIFVGMVTTVAMGVIILAALVYFGIIPIEIADVTESSSEQVIQTTEKPKKLKKDKPKKARKEKRKGKSKAGKLTSVPEKPMEPKAMTIEQLKTYLEECLQSPDDRIKEQFSELRKEAALRASAENLTTNYGNDPNNKDLNRFQDIIPYDQTLVLLKGNCIMEEEAEGYINASYVYAVEPCKDAYSSPSLDRSRVDYIAAQAPLRRTVADFWQLVAENRVTLIVMLTQLREGDTPKSAKYWPDEVYATTSHVWSGSELTVTLIAEQDHPSFVIRTLSLVSVLNVDEPVTVTQIQMKSWPDHGVPDVEEFAAVIDEYRRLKDAEPPGQGPSLIHCSAGVGRSGIFIAADVIRRQLEKGVQYFDIQSTILQLRMCRMHMVEKAPQYVFLHMYLKSLLENY
ncbi:hypothetical protein CRM22_010113 [Opisthorchis felineus]|uniref:Uncharacterized protein n=1 Tax=Opisthorchis felineus TaxID=147828 RepID=A0A4S2L1S3_OPIFE|nr:hypothetical protein CRM22_010113 [Opisthorchis felineus]